MGNKRESRVSRLFRRRLPIPIIVLAIIATGPFLSYVRPVGAASYLPGVSGGDTAIYGNVTAAWGSSSPSLAPPPFLAEFLNVRSINLTVQNVSDSNITAIQTFTFTNGTAPQTSTLDGSVASSVGNLTFWILAGGLTADSPLYNFPNSPTINTTETQFFAGAFRQVNHFILNVSVSGENATVDWGWDSSTGVLVSFATNYSYSSTSGSFEGHAIVEMTSTNLWSAGPPQFAIFPGGNNLTVNAGTSVTDGIYVISLNGTSGTVSLTAQVSPAGPTLTLSQSTVVLSSGGNASSLLSIATTASTPAQSYTVSIIGTIGSVSQTANIELTVRSPNSPDFSISANPSFQQVSVLIRGNYTITVTSLNGFNGTVVLGVSTGEATVSLQPATITGSGVVILRAIATITGNYSIEVIATSGYLYHTVTVYLGVVPASQTPSYAITGPSIITVTPGNTTQATVIVSSLNNFTGTVSLTPAVIPAFTNAPVATLSPSLVSVSPEFSGVSTLIITTTLATVTGPYNYTISGTASFGGGLLSEFFAGQLVVQPSPQLDFSLSVYPTSLLATAGSSTSATIDVFPTGPVSGNLTVFLSAQVPSINGLTATLFPISVLISPSSFGGESTLTVGTLSTTPTGNYTVTVVGHGGAFTHNATIMLQVLPPPVLVLTPTSGLVGTKVLVQGSGFPAEYGQTELLVTFDDQLVGFTFTSTGSFSFTFDVPVAQPGFHTVKASEPGLTGTSIVTANATFQVLPSPISLTVNLSGGTLYFPGDTATFFVLVTQNGRPATVTGLQVTLQIIKPNGATQTITMTSSNNGVYTATYAIPSRNSLGTYGVVVKATSASTGTASSLTSFEVKPTWLQSNGMNIAAGTTVAGLVGLVGLAWQQGVFKKKRDDKSFDWNNWNGSSAKPQL
jgi:hypothetical protein